MALTRVLIWIIRLRLMLFTLILDLIQTKSKKKTVVDENGVIKTAFIVEHDLGGGETAYIELYDIEEAHFYENGEVTIKTLTDGNVYVFDSVTYNENVKFHVYRDEQGVAQIQVTNDKGKKGIETLFEGCCD